MKNSAFLTGKVPITKEEVRSLALSKLQLKGKKRMIDVGAGTGTVGIEAAYSYEQLQVIAIECMEEACLLTQKNIEHFGLKNIQLVWAKAPIPLEDKVDAIFIGGTRGNLEEILEWSYEYLQEKGRLVAHFIVLDHFYRAKEKIESLGFKEIEVLQVGINKLEPLGRYNYFKPENPIFMIEATK